LEGVDALSKYYSIH